MKSTCSESTNGVARRVPGLALVALVALLTLPACDTRAQEPAGPPDIVLLVVDTLRADRMGCYGYGRDTTPVMDRLAREGTLVERAMAQSSWTLPSMVSMLTSRYITGYCDTLPEDVPTLAELLKDEGYLTVAIVANGLLRPEKGFARGFDLYDIADRSRRDELAPTPYRDAAEVLAAVRAALGEVEARLASQPLFLYVHWMDPHSPYIERPHLAEFLPLDGAPPFGADGWHAQAFRGLYGELPPDWEEQLEYMAELRAKHDQEIRYADEAIGTLLEDLRLGGRLGNAVVAIASDHGEGLYDHLALKDFDPANPLPASHAFQLEHGNWLYEELVHTPLILWGRGVPRGLRLAGSAENIDLMPTLLDLAGAPTPEEVVGQSLLPRLSRPDHPGPEQVFAWVLPNAAVHEPRTGWKLSVPTHLGAERGATPRLHHLPSDPLERDNRFHTEPETARRLHGRLVRWLEEHPLIDRRRELISAEFLADLEALGYTDSTFRPPEQEGQTGIVDF